MTPHKHLCPWLLTVTFLQTDGETISLEQHNGVKWFQVFDETTVAGLGEHAKIFWQSLATRDVAYFDFVFVVEFVFLFPVFLAC